MPQPAEPLMGLVLPTENSDAGTWDATINTAFLDVAAHNHTTGEGVKVPSAGLDINADLSFSSSGSFFAAKDVKALDFQPQAASGMTSYSSALFSNSTDSNNLYFRNSAGTNVRITNGNALDITASGGIAGDYIATGAEVSFSDANKEYTFKQKDPDNFWAALRSGPLRIAQIDTTEAVYVEVIAPAALASSYTITLPDAAPGAGAFVQMSSAGVLSASSALPANQSVTVSGTGVYKHGDKELYVPAFKARAEGTWTIVTGRGLQTNAGANILHFPLELAVGARIRSVTFYYTRAGGTLTFSLVRLAVSGTTTTVISTTTVNTGTTQTSVTLSSVDHTILTGNQYLAHVESGANGDTVYAISVIYDQP